MTMRSALSAGSATLTKGLVNFSTMTSDGVGALEEAIHAVAVAILDNPCGHPHCLCNDQDA
jgi:hypothetical protein